MTQYTKEQYEEAKKVYGKLGKYINPIGKLDEKGVTRRRLLEITTRLVHNLPVTKALTQYYEACAGIGGDYKISMSPPPKPHSEELSKLVAAYIEKIGLETGNYVTGTLWFCWPLVATPVHKSGTPPKKGQAKQEVA